MKVLTSKDIEKHISMPGLVEEIEKAYTLLEEGKSVMPIRTISDLGEGYPLVFFKPVIETENGHIAVKLLNQLKETSKDGFPTIQGLVILIDSKRNEILSVMDGRSITALRTGAASGLATKLLARIDASVLAVFGAGAQAYTQIKAVLAVRNIKKVIVFDISENATERLISYFGYEKEVEFVKGTDITMLKEADVICTVTNSTIPLFRITDLKEGVHINAIGSFSEKMREMPDDIYVGAYLYVDHKESCFKESGDIIGPLSANLIDETNYKGELKDILLGKSKGRDNDVRRTVFKSVGIATQDLVAADYIFRMSEKEEFGTYIDF